MLKDNIGLELKNLDKIPIPVDTHVIRATLATGVIRGKFEIRKPKLIKYTQEVWFESFKKLQNEDIDLIPLNMDKPLWHLSKNGCYKRDKITGNCPYYSECIAKEFCVKGMIKIKDDIVEVNT
jgi:endonuclease III